MKTDPTPSIASSTGMPLSHEAIHHARNLAARANPGTQPKDAISDTLETTDREADGRRPGEAQASNADQPSPSNGQQTTGDRLDLTG